MLRPALALLTAVVALTACGEEDSRPAATTTGPPTTATAPPNAKPSRTPEQTLAAVRKAVRGAESFHIEGTQTDGEGITRLEGDVAADGAIRLDLVQKGAVVNMIILDEETVYLRADEAFWKRSSAPPSVGELLAGRWAKVPADEETAELAEQVQPDVIALCLGESVGTTSIRSDTLDGDEVLVLVDKGDKPGTAPGELYVAADDPQLPLRVRQTGARRPGGPPVDPRCDSDDEEGPEDRSDIRLSRWNEPVTIEAPADALDLEELADQADDEPAV